MNVRKKDAVGILLKENKIHLVFILKILSQKQNAKSHQNTEWAVDIKECLFHNANKRDVVGMMFHKKKAEDAITLQFQNFQIILVENVNLIMAVEFYVDGKVKFYIF